MAYLINQDPLQFFERFLKKMQFFCRKSGILPKILPKLTLGYYIHNCMFISYEKIAKFKFLRKNSGFCLIFCNSGQKT